MTPERMMIAISLAKRPLGDIAHPLHLANSALSPGTLELR